MDDRTARKHLKYDCRNHVFRGELSGASAEAGCVAFFVLEACWSWYSSRRGFRKPSTVGSDTATRLDNATAAAWAVIAVGSQLHYHAARVRASRCRLEAKT